MKKAFSVWVLIVLLMVSLPSVVTYYSARSRSVGGYPVNVSTSQSETQIATNFSIIVLPDTQFYSASYPDIFDNQTQWIADNPQSMNIVFVTQEGDIVNDYSSLSQWNNANNSISRLDLGNVSYGVLPGNHDGSPGNVANYNIYFNYSRFNGRSWYGGAYQNDNSNNFELFHGDQDDYLIFHFQYQPSDQVLAWANNTLQNFPNRRFIVTTHSYLNVDGTRTDIGQRIWESLIAPHADRIFLVLCGHNHAEVERQDTVNGHTVYQLLADYQDRVNGGNGWLRILQFCPGNDKICVRTYSPYLDSYENDSDSQFTLSYDMTGAKVIVVPDDYSTIQEAINAAWDGDTVFVRNGTYDEYVVVDKTVSLIGEDAASTIIEYNGAMTSNIVTLISGNVMISGFTIRCPPYERNGIWLCQSSNNDRISGNNIASCATCIYVDGASGNDISRNNLTDNSYGICLSGFQSSNNSISENIITDSVILGIGLYESSDSNSISGNNISRNYHYGIYLESSNNNVSGNNIADIYYYGILLEFSGSNNNISGNSIANNTYGIWLSESSNNSIYHNSFLNNTIDNAGVGFLEALNIPSGNIVSERTCGVEICENSVNSLYYSNLLSTNFWDSSYPSGGNFWSDYNGSDLFSGPAQDQLGSDGIGDIPYVIDSNNVDHYPLMSPWSAHAPIRGDLNGDKTVDIYDAIILAGAYNSKPGDSNWKPAADINNDGIVDIFDALVLAANYGRSWV